METELKSIKQNFAEAVLQCLNTQYNLRERIFKYTN